MISCPECQYHYKVNTEQCPKCSFSPKLNDGFKSWAPNLAKQGGGFKPESFHTLFQAESKNFWFRARNKIIQWALKKYAPKCQSFLEVGCGTGFVLSGIKNTIPTSNITGSEIFTTGLTFAAERVPDAELVQMDARNLPYREEFDVVSAFDVIEHIDEDELVLSNLFHSLKSDGIIMITVPQHQWLWSDVDVQACHVRRYSADDLHHKIESAGFNIICTTSFVSFLLPAMFLSRYKMKGNKDSETESELNINPLVNFIFEKILDIERLFIQLGVRFPVGGSRLVLARKKQQ